jgi:hypothetical protein
MCLRRSKVGRYIPAVVVDPHDAGRYIRFEVDRDFKSEIRNLKFEI